MFTGRVASSVIINLIPSTTSEQRCALYIQYPLRKRDAIHWVGGGQEKSREGALFRDQLAGLNQIALNKLLRLESDIAVGSVELVQELAWRVREGN